MVLALGLGSRYQSIDIVTQPRALFSILSTPPFFFSFLHVPIFFSLYTNIQGVGSLGAGDC